MWNNYWSGRARRDLPQVNYNESSEDDFDSPLTSPSRPPPTRAGSPVELAVPTLNDNVDEELSAVSRTLENVGHSHTFRGTRPIPGTRPDPEGEVSEQVEIHSSAPLKSDEEPEEIVNEGFIVGEAEVDLNMPDRANPVEVNFEDQNADDEAGALKEGIRNVASVHWDQSDLLFFFNQAELKMVADGVNKQYTKFQVLSTMLPKTVQDEVKPLLRKQAAEFPNNDAYKRLKHEVLRIFGPKPSAAVDRALGRVMTGLPSQLARALANDICKKELDCECCPAIVMALWKRHLPGAVRAGIARYKLSKANFNEVLQEADDIFTSNPSGGAAIAAATSAINLDETQPGLSYPVPEVAAVRGQRGGRGGRYNRGGRGNRGNRGGGGGGQQQQSNDSGSSGPRQYKGTKHPDLPQGDWTGCQQHFRWGKSAHFCQEPATCPWKNVFKPK